MDDKKERFLEIVDYYVNIKEDGEQEQIIRLLHETQEIYDHIPLEAQTIIAEKMGVKSSMISVLIKMIPSLRSQTYKYKVTVCSGPRCGAKGGAEILTAVQKALGIKVGQVSKDGKFYLTTQNCLKKCGLAPNMYVDDSLHSKLTPELIPEILSNYK